MCSTLLKLLREAAAGKGRPGKGGKKGVSGNAAAGEEEGGDAMEIDLPQEDAGEESDEGEAAGPSQRGSQRPGGGAKGGSTASGGGPLVAEALSNLAGLLAGFGLRDQPDTVRGLAEAAAEVSRTAAVAGNAEAAEACYGLLAALLQPIHGRCVNCTAGTFLCICGGGSKA